MSFEKIALTGGIATGKSTVARRFRELGAIILDADEYARQAVMPGTLSYAALRDLVGWQHFNPDGTLKRGELRSRIIREPALRQEINDLLHPYIWAAMRSDWEKLKKLAPQSVIIFDIPLLFETAAEKDFDIVILVYASRETQIQRLMLRDKVSASEAEMTLSMQLPIDSKRDHCDYVIENSGDIEIALRQVDEIWAIVSK